MLPEINIIAQLMITRYVMYNLSKFTSELIFYLFVHVCVDING